jgi:hypothetical protein
MTEKPIVPELPEDPELVGEEEEDEQHPFTMTVDLSVVESLGINLYSNAAAVLSELVANAYDADASHVQISWRQSKEQIVVSDNGMGMTADDLNARFLKVGYKKRAVEGSESPKWNRPYMGRKGIGKLSVFSIAKVVSVFSVTADGESNGFKIDVPSLETAIKAGKPYHPEPIPVPAEYAGGGTVIVLDDLKTKRADITALALRKRLARRFDVMDDTPQDEGGFHIEVNGKRVDWEDRQELKKLEFIWEFGEDTLPDHALPKEIRRFKVASNVVNADQNWVVRGWIGTAAKPTDLTDDVEAGSLKNIIVLARKRPIQEGIVEKLDFSRLFGNYVTGQIEADFLDLDDDYEDIATSDRQRLMEDDERVVQLQTYLRSCFVRAADQWSDERPKKKGADVLRRFPKLREWVDARPGWQKSSAERMIGTIASIELERGVPEESRNALFRAGVLAFERIGLRQVSDELESLSSVNANDLLALLGRQDFYESAMWADILRSRVEAIGQFKNLTKANEKEKVLQTHLFDHLHLLDPSWERAAVGGTMEEDLREVAPGLFAKNPKGEEIKGRLDIRYATAAGKHVIVELKRFSVHEEVEKYREQGLKYYNALRSLLTQQNRADEKIEVVFVLGQKPKTTNAGGSESDAFIQDQFRSISARYVLYGELIANASNQYQQYLDATAKTHDLDELLNDLGSGRVTAS